MSPQETYEGYRREEFDRNSVDPNQTITIKLSDGTEIKMTRAEYVRSEYYEPGN